MNQPQRGGLNSRSEAVDGDHDFDEVPTYTVLWHPKDGFQKRKIQIPLRLNYTAVLDLVGRGPKGRGNLSRRYGGN